MPRRRTWTVTGTKVASSSSSPSPSPSFKGKGGRDYETEIIVHSKDATLIVKWRRCEAGRGWEGQGGRGETGGSNAAARTLQSGWYVTRSRVYHQHRYVGGSRQPWKKEPRCLRSHCAASPCASVSEACTLSDQFLKAESRRLELRKYPRAVRKDCRWACAKRRRSRSWRKLSLALRRNSAWKHGGWLFRAGLGSRVGIEELGGART